MNTLFLVQAAVPLALILWMALASPRSTSGFCIQLAASAASLWAAAWLGIWLVPPWWAPWGFGAGLLAAAWLGLRQRRPFASPWPRTLGAWVVAALFTALGVASAYGIVTAWHSRTPAPLPLVNLVFPLGPGHYLVVNGGSDSSTNAHIETLDGSESRFRHWRGQSYGIDLVQIDGLGLRAKGLQPADPRAYRIYGALVLAPCAGRVVLAVDGLPDMQVPQMDRAHMAGNHVLLRCEQADVLLGHLSPGSVRVRVGDAVAAGVWLGSVGNSGNTGEPHLHVHAQRPGPVGAPLGGDPLPILFNGRFPVRGNRIGSP
ncbi:MAG: peptidoglycan DD-metalloendopeptidase family protein [Burkholderiaceae bacterium]|uniref:peptidoglycan DD-metalloendopeptidase family protein n=1 Tax=Polaromonas sp. TaxID=1869339 RepID=UPI0013BA355D|nr:peptidoglycan DD-metalloendopeptidase family protein [Polaromonas sp.]NDP64208.1 peptidoglycan DD-metalloendopeptidase family protein [Polaromonas sp.]